MSWFVIDEEKCKVRLMPYVKDCKPTEDGTGMIVTIDALEYAKQHPDEVVIIRKNE